MPTIVDKAALNNTGSKPVEGHSTFPLNQQIAGGYRFGLYQPCSVDDTVPDDTLPLKSAHELRSMNLKAPLLGDVKLHKEWFDVPFSVMLPLNYEKLFVQPNIGQDVDASEVGLNVASFPKKVVVQLRKIYTALSSGVSYESSAIHGLFCRLLMTINSIFSSGSLLSSLGEDISATWDGASMTDLDGNSTSYNHIDRALDLAFMHFREYFIELADATAISGVRKHVVVNIDGDVFALDPSAVEGDQDYITFRQFFERVADASSVSIITTDETVHGDYAPWSIINTILNGFGDVDENLSLDKDLSIGRPLAYQLSCAEFFTNSHVDYIYSAQLYRQNIYNLLSYELGIDLEYFTWNGVRYLYDTLSAHSFNKFFAYYPSWDNESEDFDVDPNLFLDFYRLVFGYNRSLRYVDYFTGSRTRPLAVGDVNVQVNSGYVNVIDVIEKRWAAKFYNQVNRIGRKLSEYMKGLFPGVHTSRDMHDPMWLAHVVDSVNAIETQNTGVAQQENQNSITSNLISNGQRYAFEYSPERYGICIGILYFDIARFYPHVIERNNFNVDRNDYFNPFLQLLGDQKVYKDELYSGEPHTTFGYQGRDMQYKQKVDRCFGPFTVPGLLPGWLFIAKDDAASLKSMVQSPSYIRAWSSEFDQFYNALTGYTYATYFHFLVINTNNMNASRPMIANPQLD